jgi:hypothetical protein
MLVGYVGRPLICDECVLVAVEMMVREDRRKNGKLALRAIEGDR